MQDLFGNNEEADVIVVGPGDLYSSIIPCFLPEGMKEAFARSKAVKIFVAPAMTKLGETYKYSLEDFVAEIEKYLGAKPDFIIYGSAIPSEQRLEEYKSKNPHLHELCLPRGADKRFVGATSRTFWVSATQPRSESWEINEWGIR